jgi:hypothetical protein
MIATGRCWSITSPTHVVHAVKPVLAVELRSLPKPGLGRDIFLMARKGELGDLHEKIVMLCRRMLQKEYLPRLRALMPSLTDHFTVVDESDQMNTSE